MFLAETDVKNAFRIIPIRPLDYSLLGMRWRNLYYYDRCMPMGCSSSCKTFEILSTAMEWIADNKLRINHIIHLLDDFLIIARSQTLCQDQLRLFLDLCSYLGIPIAILVPRAAILLASDTDRDLWQGPKQEVRESRTSGFCAQPQKFETITVTIGYKNGQLLHLRVTLAPARGLDPWR